MRAGEGRPVKTAQSFALTPPLPPSQAAPLPQPRAPWDGTDVSVAGGLSHVFHRARRGAGRVGTDTGPSNVRPNCLPPAAPTWPRQEAGLPPRPPFPPVRTRSALRVGTGSHSNPAEPGTPLEDAHRTLRPLGGSCLASPASARTVTFDVDLETPSIFGGPAPSISDPWRGTVWVWLSA